MLQTRSHQHGKTGMHVNRFGAAFEHAENRSAIPGKKSEMEKAGGTLPSAHAVMMEFCAR
ncbi:hypothetical protein ACNHE5_19855 [Pandoraea pnomenusa]